MYTTHPDAVATSLFLVIDNRYGQNSIINLNQVLAIEKGNTQVDVYYSSSSDDQKTVFRFKSNEDCTNFFKELCQSVRGKII
jgi:Mg/Co/Ni transporter MgtE